MLIHACPLNHSYFNFLIHFLTQAHNHPPIHSHTYPLTNTFTQPFNLSHINSRISHQRPISHIYSLNRLLIHSLNHSVIHAFINSHIHSFNSHLGQQGSAKCRLTQCCLSRLEIPVSQKAPRISNPGYGGMDYLSIICTVCGRRSETSNVEHGDTKKFKHDVTKKQPLQPYLNLAINDHHGYHQRYDVLHRNWCISHSLHNLHIQRSVLELPMYRYRNELKIGRHVMMTSSNGNIFRVTGHLCGKFTGPRWISRTKASDAELWCFFDLHLNKRLSKQPWGWWFETPEWSLWRHRNV